MSLNKIATKNVVTISTKSSVYDAAKLMRESHVGDVVVVEEQYGKKVPVGIVTDRDIVVSTVAFNLLPESVQVDEIMGPTLASASPKDSFYHVLTLMREHGIKRIPLMNEHGGLEGIISADDIIAVLASELGDIAKITEVQRNIETSRRRKLA